MEQSKHGGWWVVAAVVVTLVLYVGSYFVLTQKRSWMFFRPLSISTPYTRDCPYPWTIGLYRPLATVEEAITGDQITIR